MLLILLTLFLLLFLILAIVFVVLYFMKDCGKTKLAATFLEPVASSTLPPATGAGFSTIDIKKEKKEMTINVFIGQQTSSPITMAHIHVQNDDGTLGEPVVPLGDFSFTDKITDTLLVKNMTVRPSDFIGPLKGQSIDTFIQMLTDGKLWINVHSKDYPKGEIQGKLFFLST